MAFDYTDPGYAFVSELTNALMQRQAMRRQAMLDELNRKQVEGQLADREALRKIQEENAASNRDQREAQAAERKAKVTKEKMGATPIGAILDPGTAQEFSAMAPGSVSGRAPTVADVERAPAVPVAPPSEAAGAPLPQQKFAGTRAQQEEAANKQKRDALIATLPEDHPLRQYFQLRDTLGPDANDEKVLASFLQTKTKPTTKPVVRINPKTGHLETLGDAPADAHFVTEPTPPEKPNMLALLGGDKGPAIDMLAKALRRGDTQVLANLGWSNAGADLKAAVLARSTHYDMNTDTFGEQPIPDTPDLAGARADYAANKQSLGQITKNYDAVNAFAKTAQKNGELLKGVLAKIPSTASPMMNTPLRALDRKVVGDENIAVFNTIRQAVQNEYGRIISQPNMAGVLSDSARQEAKQLIDGDLSPNMMLKVLATLEQEAGNRRTSYQEQIDAINGRISGKKPGPGILQPGKKSGFKVTIE